MLSDWMKANRFPAAALAVAVIGSVWAIGHFRQPGHLDVVAAQAMDMSQMRPPAGRVAVHLGVVRAGTLDDTAAYPATVLAYSEQVIAPRVAGRIATETVYPGQSVRAGQVLATLDNAELSAQADKAGADVSAARYQAQAAQIAAYQTHHAMLDIARANLATAQTNVTDARAQSAAAAASIPDAEAASASAQAAADYAAIQLSRTKTLLDDGVIARQDYDRSVAASKSAQAALAQAKAHIAAVRSQADSASAKVAAARQQSVAALAGLDQEESNVRSAHVEEARAQAAVASAGATARQAAVLASYTTITAPAGGVVTDRMVAPGQYVEAGAPVLKMAQIDRVRVQANVAVSDLAGVAIGAPVTLADGNGAVVAHSRVTSIFPSADPNTRTAVVEALVDNPERRMLPGALLDMRIGKSADARGAKMVVPASAVQSVGGQSFVWVAEGAASGASGPQKYQCVICHIVYSAADAQRYGYKDPMEGGKLVPLPGSEAKAGRTTARKALVTAGASDGQSTEISSSDGAVKPGDKVIDQGAAALAEGQEVEASL